MTSTLTDQLASVRPRPLSASVGRGGIVLNVIVGLILAFAGVIFGQWLVTVVGIVWICLAFTISAVVLRVGVTLIGLLLFFQNEAVSGTEKLAFVGVAAIFAITSLTRILRFARTRTPLFNQSLRLALIGCGIFAVVPFASLAQLSISGAALDAWLRDGVTYLLIPIAMLVGLEAGLSLRPRLIFVIALAASTLGGISSLIAWLSRRGGDELGFEQFGLASSLTVFAGLALCLTLFFNGSRMSILWLVGGLSLAGLLVGTGGRQAAVFALLAVVIAAFAASSRFFSRLTRGVVLALGAIVTLSVIIAVSESFAGGIAARRLDFFSRFADEGWSVVGADGSALDRSNAYAWTLNIWLNNPLAGRGLGLPFPSVRSGQTLDGDFTLDTPLVVLAKFGVLGTVLLSVALALAFIASVRAAKFAEYAPLSSPTFVITSYALVAVTMFNGFPTENKGLPVFLLLTLAISLSTAGPERRNAQGRSSQIFRHAISSEVRV